MPKPAQEDAKERRRAAAGLKIPPELLDQLVKGPMTAGGGRGVCRAFKKALIERALGAELSHHLGYARARRSRPRARPTTATARAQDGADRRRPGAHRGAARPGGQLRAAVIAKHERRFTGFDDKIIAMYARGMTVREIQGFLAEMYGIEVSPEFISTVTDAVMAEVTAWQSRPLEPMYPVVFFDALRVKIRDEGVVRNKAVYLALGVLPDGTREVLGLWIEQTEGAKFWLKVFNELKTRGVDDILIAVVDGLKGFPEAIEAVFPATTRADLHRASDPQQPRLRELEGPQGGSPPRSSRSTRPPAPRRPRRRSTAFEAGPWGQKYPTIAAVLAARLGARDPVLRVPAGSAPGDLHHQRDREPAHAAAQDHQDPRPLPERRGRHQAALAGPAQHPRRQGAIGLGLEDRHEPIRHPLRRPVHRARQRETRLTHRISDRSPTLLLFLARHGDPCRPRICRRIASPLRSPASARPRFAHRPAGARARAMAELHRGLDPVARLAPTDSRRYPWP